jgi:hypothetical protein
MVIPFGAPEVAHLIHHCLEPVVHCYGSSPLLRTNRSSLLSIVSRMVIFVTSSPSCAVLRRPKSLCLSSTLAPYYTPLDIKRRGEKFLGS